MDINKVDPEIQKSVKNLPTLPLHIHFLLPLFRILAGVVMNTKAVKGVKVENHQNDQTRIRIYTPNEIKSDAALLWIHGGGLILGTAAQNDEKCSRYARDLGIIVISVDYRLAPKHPFPAPLDDCYAAWEWTLKLADSLNIDQSKIVIGGESAGGGLAACLAQKIRDAGGVQPISQMLFCPMLDDRTAADKSLDSEEHYLWNNSNNRGGWSAYLGHQPGQAQEPDYAVGSRLKDYTGLPPAWIGIGNIDLFYNENCEYAEQLKKAGVPCELDIVPMAPHGFNSLAPKAKVTIEFNQRNEDYLRKVLNLKK